LLYLDFYSFHIIKLFLTLNPHFMKLNLFPITGKAALTAGTLSILFLTSCEKATQEISPANEDIATSALRSSNTEPGQEFVPNQLLVKFRRGTSAEAKTRALEKIGGKVSEKILTKTMERFGDTEGLLVVNTPLAAVDAISKVRGVEGIEYAEPNYIYQHQAISNDPYYTTTTSNKLWGMYGDATTPNSNQYGSQAGEAWAAGKTGSQSVIVGIIDEGIQFTHPDLAANIWTNPYEIPNNGIDDDKNGYKDDIHGWDFDGNNNSIYDGGTNGGLDDHGTHVAGTIGAIGGNGTGVAGVNWNVTMISCKFLGRRGGTTANAVKACDYLTDLKTRHGMNIVASNNSWGGGGFSQALLEAILRADAQNILFVAAAGNGGSDGVGDNNDVTPSYPSNYISDNVIAVASITSSGALSSFSNYGATTVDIGAPGSGIISTTAYNTYSNYSGTSMATPHVTGAVALYAAYHSTANAADIKKAILDAAKATPTPSLNTPVPVKCVTGGRLNVSGF
jgi:subtilisin family serine protease